MVCGFFFGVAAALIGSGGICLMSADKPGELKGIGAVEFCLGSAIMAINTIVYNEGWV
jgi:hypothetical protein